MKTATKKKLKKTATSKKGTPSKKTHPKMNIVIVGHVDHGKSTVIGRLLADTNSLPKGKLQQVRDTCARSSKPFEYAFLLDALKDEQAQGITIDSARCFFKSKKREYIIIDAPGHIEFLKNMVSGAARAEAALLVIDAHEGIQENSKRHGYLLSMLGIKQVAVCVNKMDLVDYSEAVFNKIEKDFRKFLTQIGLKSEVFLPISAREGDNIATKSKNLSWYKGPSILSLLDGFRLAPTAEKQPFRLPLQDIYKFTAFSDDRRIFAGRVEAGSLTVGDEVIFFPSHKKSEVKSIESFNTASKKSVSAGVSTGITLKQQIYVNRGEIMCKVGQTHPSVSTLIRVDIFWMGKKPMTLDKDYKIKIGTAAATIRIHSITKVIDASDLKNSEKNKVERHDVAECILQCDQPIAFDTTSDIEATGRFVIVDEYDIAGGGIIRESVKDEQAEIREQVFEREMKWESSLVHGRERMQGYGHKRKLILITGDVKYDKKVIAKKVEKALFEEGHKTYFLGIGNLLRGLDMDVMRRQVSRNEHVRRLAEVAHLMVDAGLLVVATASNLRDEDIAMLKEVTDRNSTLVIAVGKHSLKRDAVDLALNVKDSAALSTKKVLKFLESNKVFNLDS